VWEKVIRTVLVDSTILLLFRVTGKRGLANVNTLDFVVIFLLSNVVQNAVIGNDTSFSGGAVGAVTLAPGRPDPGGRFHDRDPEWRARSLILTLKPAEQTATKQDIAAVLAKLEALNAQISSAGPLG
jgi:hypothetical protein